MTAGRFNWSRMLVIAVPAVIIIAGGIVALLKYDPGQPVEISLTSRQQDWQGEVNISGAVASPGIYPLYSGDTLDDLIGAAGGATATANLSGLRLHVPARGETAGAQKIDINRADEWLLAALPGIGDTLARRIVEYREEHGLFRNTAELMKVEGIGEATFERIKDLITVAD
jgi:competence protein ComEA